ncbi:MAG: Ig-like domain-containing protein [Flavobacteriales bacterium]|nr:Ig-like domain-containing protein [Flavobacteriales bacterium]MDW8431747.1 Ig-like domain-containing protein [Flavobacteriales bacterium]
MGSAFGLNYWIGSLVLFGLGWGCARVVPLSGGDTDVLPPRPVKYQPDSATRLFNQKKIRIRFNEYIQLRDPTREILVSPPLNGNLSCQVQGKWLTIRLPEESLRSATTYLIQFGNAIADITEGNVLKDFYYVFTTGTDLDSGAFSGTVFSLPEGQPQKDMRVALYPDTLPDSLLLLKPPLYFAQCNDQGRFSFRFIHPGKYKVGALGEENNNLVYDRPGERIAFHPRPIEITSATPPLDLVAFREKPRRLTPDFLVYEKAGRVSLPFWPGLKVEPIRTEYADSLFFRTCLNDREDSLILFFREPPVPSKLSWLVEYPGKFAPDTLVLVTKFPKKTAAKTGRSASGYMPSLISKYSGNVNFKEPLQIQFSEPVLAFDSARIGLLQAGKNLRDFKLAKADSAGLVWHITTDLKPETEYRLVFGRGAFISLNAQVSDSVAMDFKTLASAAFSDIFAGIKDSLYAGGAVVVELLDEKMRRIRPRLTTQEGQVSGFRDLPAGRYRLRFIYDRNRNGLWDTGDFRLKVQPEEIILLSQTIELRPGLSQKIIWNPHEKRMKL